MEGNQKIIEGNECRSRLSGSPSVHPEMTVESVSDRISDSHVSKKSTREMLAALSRCLSDDSLAADAKWNLFIAACQSYRYDSCLKPFPPMFLSESRKKDINLLLKTIDDVPSFLLLKKFLSCSEKFKLNDTGIRLLYWVLVQMRDPSLKTIPKSQFSKVLDLVPCEMSAKKPDYIFKVIYSTSSAHNIKWQNYKRSYRTLFAYHGSRLENFHSIIHYGLQLSLTKTPLYGEGIYLSSELLVSLPYSSTGFGWGKSLMGAELSVIALCEVLDHPSVHCQTEGSKDKERATASDSIAGEVPHKYYVVSNSELIRIQYLLVYARSPPPPLQINDVRRDSFIGWIRQHKLLTCIMGYVFLLASVGLSHNQNVLRYYRVILNKAGLYD